MTQDEIIEMAKQSGLLEMDYELGDWEIHEFTTFAKLVANAAIAKEREACESLHQHEDVLAPVGNSAWGEAYQEGWAAGAAAYLQAIRARGEA